MQNIHYCSAPPSFFGFFLAHRFMPGRAVLSCDVLALITLTEMSENLLQRASEALTPDTYRHMVFVADLGKRMCSSYAAEAVVVEIVERHSSDADLARAFRNYFNLARECAGPFARATGRPRSARARSSSAAKMASARARSQ